MQRPINIQGSLCSLALLLWAWQTGLWSWAIPMALLLEARLLWPQRWPLKQDTLAVVAHMVVPVVWLFCLFTLRFTSPSVFPYSFIYHLLKGIPIACFPVILCYAYTTAVDVLYRDLFNRGAGAAQDLNLYAVYFGLCLLAASTTTGHLILFLALLVVLVGLFLWSLRPRHPKLGLFLSLMVMAFLLSILGTAQLHWLQSQVAHVRVDLLRHLLPKRVHHPRPRDPNDIPLPPDNWARRVPPIDPEVFPPGQEQPSAKAPAPRNPAAQRPPDASGRDRTGQRPATPNRPGSGPPVNLPLPSKGGGPPPSPRGESSRDRPRSGQGGDMPLPGSGGDPFADIGQSGDPLADSLIGESEPGGSDPFADLGRPGSGREARPDALPPQASNRPAPSRSRSDPAPQPSPAVAQRPHQGTNASGGQGSRSAGTAEANPETSRTRIGKIGSLQQSNTIVFRVAPLSKPTSFPLYIREATYDQYREGTWTATRPAFTQKTAQSHQSWTFPANPRRQAAARIFAQRRRAQGLLKLPMGTVRVEDLAVNALSVNPYGTVAIAGDPGPLAYTVHFDPLRVWDPRPTAADLQMSASEQQVIQDVLRSQSLIGASGRETIASITRFFKDNFEYSLDLSPPGPDQTPLAAFLEDHRSGHCEYFASATTLMLRAAGIPARYTVGYVAHEYSASDQQYIVRTRDAHAWVLAYVNGAWRTVETTPGNGISPDSFEQRPAPGQEAPPPAPEAAADQKTSPVQTPPVAPQEHNQGPQDPASPAAELSGDDLSDYGAGQPQTPATEQASETDLELIPKSWPQRIAEAWSALVEQLAKGLDRDALPAIAAVAGGIAVILGSLAFALWMMMRKRKPTAPPPQDTTLSSAQARKPGAESDFYLIEQRLESWQLSRSPSEPILQWTHRLKQRLPAATMQDLQPIIDLHYRYRFDPQGLSAEEQAQLNARVEAWLATTHAVP